MRVVTYARFSSDNQRETSIEDQFRLNDARAVREGWPRAERFSDAEVSAGTPTLLRPGGKSLMEAIRTGEVDVLLIEALDRCWRDIVDQERTIREMERRGVRIVGVSDGYDSLHEDREMSRGVRGVLNQQYLRDLAKKTHRGLAGQIARGYHAGGLSYGFRSISAGVDAKGEAIGHRLEIDAQQAEHVRWIFQRYSDGWSCQKIAAELNLHKISGPRGGTWSVSALYGSRNKGSGVLNNELYIGNYVWNRSRWLKDPDTGKRIRTDRPREEWVIERREGLRIVADELWKAAKLRMNRRQRPGTRAPRSLFGGMLRCGKCGGAVIIVNKDSYGCAARKDRGASVCEGLYVSRPAADRRLLSVLRDELLSPNAVIELREELAAVIAARQSDTVQTKAKARCAVLDRELRNLTDAIAACGISEALRKRLLAVETERQALERAAAVPIIRLPAPDALVARYKQLVMDLKGALENDVPRARQILEDAHLSITLKPKGKEVWAEIASSTGRLLMAAGADIASYGCGDRI